MKHDIDSDKLPDDPQQLKNLFFEMRNKYKEELTGYEKQLNESQLRYETLEERYELLDKEYETLDEKYKALLKKFFGRSSEKLTPNEQDQLLLFNEAESNTTITEKEDSAEEECETIVVKEHEKKKGGKKPLSELLPREEKIYDLTEEEKKCFCCGKERPCIGQEETEELDIIPEQIKVIKHVRLKYGPCGCEDFFHNEVPEITIAPKPVRLIPYSIASAGLIAYIAVSKFVDGLPFYRQSKRFERIDIDISRATLCNWILEAAERCKVLTDLMWEEAIKGQFIQMDETTVQVLKEDGRAPSTNSYMWVTVGYPEINKPLIIFEYRTNRSQSIPSELLKDYKGYLQTDGYAGYNSIGNKEGIIHVGCFAHARRYFYDAFMQNKKSDSAKKGLSYIQKIYQIEKELREKNLLPEEFVKKRKETVMPLLEEFYKWLQEKVSYIPPESKTGQAIEYAIHEWSKLIKYLDAYFLTPDNNRVENAIRPFVLGRRNWLFSNTPRGAESSAIMYSLIESAKANGLEPYRYLRYLFTKLPLASSKAELKQLLPNNLQSDIFLSV